MSAFLWLIRRELWENRAIWIIPALVGALLVLAAVFGDIDLKSALPLAPPDQPRVGGALYLFGFGVALFFIMSLYSAWYLLDCLYVERKDRSVLFWRALPVSDRETVLSKLVTALIVIPLVAFLAADVVTFAMALAVTVRGSQAAPELLWNPDNWLQLQVLWIYLIAATSLWYLPVAAWLVLVSAWARRSVALWAILPILIPYLIERWFLRTHFVGTLLADRLKGLVSVAFHNNADEAFSLGSVIDQGRTLMLPARTVWELIDARGLLENPATWIGVGIACALIAGAIELRRRHIEQ